MLVDRTCSAFQVLLVVFVMSEGVFGMDVCPYFFRGWQVLASVEVGLIPIREVSSFQRVVCTGFDGVGT